MNDWAVSRKTCLSDFWILDKLYQSTTGAVCTARHKASGRVVVLKSRRCSELGKHHSIQNELNLLERTNHPNIVKCFGSFYEGPRCLYTILEHGDRGDLHTEIQCRAAENRPFTVSQVIHLFTQISEGLLHLHQLNIAHRDLKALNVFITQSGKALIGDLGVARSVSMPDDLLHTLTGTPLYLPPELVKRQPYTLKVDCYALGALLYEMCALRPPFSVPEG
eukprot:868192_1